MTTVQLATKADIPSMLRLQNRFLFSNLTEAERLAGFVTTPFSVEQIEDVLENEQGLFVAKMDGEVVGYAFGGSWNYFSQWPIFNFMTSRFSQLRFYETIVSTENSFQYGPICVDTKMRGSGLAADLFHCVRRGFQTRYPIGLTFINQVNELSVHFHTKKLGLEIVDEFAFNEKHYFGLAFFTEQ